MCGIVGVVAAGTVDPALVERMRDTLAHRGPDHAGLWHTEDRTVVLGHRRLSIIDLDARSNQPMVSPDGRLTVTFNGEIYNFRGIRDELAAGGMRFRTESDTEVLLEAYRRWGPHLLDRLSGQFAFAIWDAEERRLFCARDRAGEKPFHYAHVGDAFLFASELKALLEWPGLPRRIDHEAVIDFLAFGFITDPRTIWKDVRKLPPAHCITVQIGRQGPPTVQEPRRYWSLPFRDGRRAGSEEIRQRILAAADEMAVADVPLGTFLSGGVDSSSVTAALSLSGHDVQSFTIGFDAADYDERRWARRVADRYHTAHVERTVDPSDVVTVFDKLAWHYDEPFGDYSAFPTYYLCREARSAITVALSGDGADEIFAGYRKYQRLVRMNEVGRIVPRTVARVVADLARRTLPEGSHWRRTLRQYGLAPAPMLADMLCHGFPLPLLRQVARGPLADTLKHYDPHRLVDHLLRDAPPQEVGLVNAMRHLDFTLTLPGDMLTKVDRASMAVSLEVRPLFLHRDVMELAADLPARSLASRDSAKIALKDAVRPWLPDDLLDRRKQGFALPLPEWLGGDSTMARKVRAAAESGPLGDLLDLDRLQELTGAQAGGRARFTAIIHSAFILDQWYRTWTTA